MALRGFVKRWESIRAPSFSTRFLSSDGKVLTDEERAAETMYIKKMEKEKLEKAKQGAKHEEPTVGSSTSKSSSYSIPESASDSSKNFAVLAGVTALVAGGWLWIQPGSTIEEKKKIP